MTLSSCLNIEAEAEAKANEGTGPPKPLLMPKFWLRPLAS